MNDPIVMELPNDRTETYVKTIRNQMKPSLQMVVVIFPTQRDDRYSSVKKLCCIESPIPSQVGIPRCNVLYMYVYSFGRRKKCLFHICNVFVEKADKGY